MKRHASLAALSRDHHHALVLAQSIKRDAPSRLRDALPRDDNALVEAVRERFGRELEPHFDVEERVLLPQCRGGTLKQQAEQIAEEHRSLRAMVAELSSDERLAERLDALGRALDDHIRFEEREWFVTLERELGDAALVALRDQLRPLPVARIERFELDDEGVWVAYLDCGHRQHVRHDPPWQARPWVASEQGRHEHLGILLPCRWCRLPRLPLDAEEYGRTATLDEQTTPAGLKRSHRLKEGSWGEIVVTQGRVLYVLEDEGDLGFVLTPLCPGVVAPGRPHHVEPSPDSRFFVRFLRVPASSTEAGQGNRDDGTTGAPPLTCAHASGVLPSG